MLESQTPLPRPRVTIKSLSQGFEPSPTAIMSLAASLAHDGMRPASFLPAIKCSDCGHEIEISAMGEHICTKAPEPEMPAANPYQYKSTNPYESVYMANPFTMKTMDYPISPPMNANGFPATSPLQYSQPAIPPLTSDGTADDVAAPNHKSTNSPESSSSSTTSD